MYHSINYIYSPSRSIHFCNLSHVFVNKQNVSSDDIEDFNMEDDPMAHELLKTATCVIVEDPEKLLAKLPSDIQVTSH